MVNIEEKIETNPEMINILYNLVLKKEKIPD